MTISDFKEKTKHSFHHIADATDTDIENIVIDYIQGIMPNLRTIDVIIYGSRCRGKEHTTSDIDVILYYDDDIKEDHLFNILNETPLQINGLTVDINPLSAKTTDIEYYLDKTEKYLSEKNN